MPTLKRDPSPQNARIKLRLDSLWWARVHREGREPAMSSRKRRKKLVATRISYARAQLIQPLLIHLICWATPADRVLERGLALFLLYLTFTAQFLKSSGCVYKFSFWRQCLQNTQKIVQLVAISRIAHRNLNESASCVAAELRNEVTM